jgi:hypothetical protein
MYFFLCCLMLVISCGGKGEGSHQGQEGGSRANETPPNGTGGTGGSSAAAGNPGQSSGGTGETGTGGAETGGLSEGGAAGESSSTGGVESSGGSSGTAGAQTGGSQTGGSNATGGADNGGVGNDDAGGSDTGGNAGNNIGGTAGNVNDGGSNAGTNGGGAGGAETDGGQAGNNSGENDGPVTDAAGFGDEVEVEGPGGIITCNMTTDHLDVPWISQGISLLSNEASNVCCGPAVVTMAKGRFDGATSLNVDNLKATIDWMDDNIASWSGNEYMCNTTNSDIVVSTIEGYVGVPARDVIIGWCELLSYLDGEHIVIIHVDSQGGNNTETFDGSGYSHWMILDQVDGAYTYVSDPGRNYASQGDHHRYTTTSVRASYEARGRLAIIIDTETPPTCTEICADAGRECGSYQNCDCSSCTGCASDCNNGQCMPESEVEAFCYDDDLYWYDSCDQRGELEQTCDYGCQTGLTYCDPPPVLTCPEICTNRGAECGTVTEGQQICGCGTCDTCENKCVSNLCEVTLQDSIVCEGGIEYWADSCGTRGEGIQSCANGCDVLLDRCASPPTCPEICSDAGRECGSYSGCDCGSCTGCASDCNNGQCMPESEVEVLCYNDDLYWHDSCGQRGQLEQTCDYGCQTGLTYCDPPSGCVPDGTATPDCQNNVRGTTDNCGTFTPVETCSYQCQSGQCVDQPCSEVCANAGRECGSYSGCDCGSCTGCESDCDNGQCQAPVLSTNYCRYGNEVWRQDACGVWAYRVMSCASDEACNGGNCEPICTSHDYFACQPDGNVHWFTSCDGDEGIKEACSYQCSNGACVNCTATQFWSPPTTTTPYASAVLDSGSVPTSTQMRTTFTANGGNIIFRICKDSGTFSGSVHVSVTSGSSLFSNDISAAGSQCTPPRTLNTSGWDEGDVFQPQVTLTVPGYTWNMGSVSMTRTCME